MSTFTLAVPFPRTVFSEDDIALIGGSGRQDENVADLIAARGFVLPENYEREKQLVNEYVADRDEEITGSDVLDYLIWLACGEFNDDPTLDWWGE